MVEKTKLVRIELNGEAVEIEPGMTIGSLLDARKVERRMVAVEHNGEIVPRYEFDLTPIAEGDRLEMLQMVGGG